MDSKFVGLALLLSGQMALSGCQTVAKIGCNTKDWRAVGVEDGVAGKLPDLAFQGHSAECAASGATIDQSAYAAGHNEGLSQFCTVASGVRQASDGFENNQLCGASFGPDFDNGYAQGLGDLCTAAGGERLGSVAKAYRGSCPIETQGQFLQSYITTLEEVALPTAQSEVEALAARSTELESSFSTLSSQLSNLDAQIIAARNSGNSIQVLALEANKGSIDADRISVSLEQRTVEASLIDARQRQSTAVEMISRWKPELSN